MDKLQDKTKSLAFQIGVGIILPTLFLVICGATSNQIILTIDFSLVVGYLIYSCATILKMKILQINLRAVILGIAGAGLAVLIQVAIAYLTGLKGGSSQVLRLNPLIIAPIVCLTGPLWEELIFRYTLNVGYFHNKFWGILVSTVLFALLHGSMRWGDLLVYFSVGLIFSFVNGKTPNILSSVIAHSLMNTLVFINLIFL
ncbi:CPBP family intramembrane glutamic endopeptidase [Lapidilactobacillus wuchangensis]|uniref:CPBP family intramembrane glutamic endopeptidase n=1 Tax=Lapidilactobacillus wuchangensis TaxID=2486001 RepID=UPI000F7A7D7D|nr:type II CAAX endopeptidase family protein [Lapidilactobacillus wuchangensis]